MLRPIAMLSIAVYALFRSWSLFNEVMDQATSVYRRDKAAGHYLLNLGVAMWSILCIGGAIK